MDDYDVIVVGGGPAGSACAGGVSRAGRRVAILDREAFPRTKLCAGWVTPGVFTTLGVEPGEYPGGLHEFDHLVIHAAGMSFRLPTRQYSVRRFEFDDFLLRRSGATVIRHEAREITKHDEEYVIDGAFRAPYLVGAGGTRCPVYRNLFREVAERNSALQIAALELEFPCTWRDPRCHLWFFEKGLPGYAWYVPKAGAWLNIGVGAIAGRLKQGGQHLHEHWSRLVAKLCQEQMIEIAPPTPAGYSYFLRDGSKPMQNGRAFLVGDAAGVATRDLGEGIGPAIRSGLNASRSILTGVPYSPYHGSGLSLDEILRNRALRLLARAVFRLLGVTNRDFAVAG